MTAGGPQPVLQLYLCTGGLSKRHQIIESLWLGKIFKIIESILQQELRKLQKMVIHGAVPGAGLSWLAALTLNELLHPVPSSLHVPGWDVQGSGGWTDRAPPHRLAWLLSSSS